MLNSLLRRDWITRSYYRGDIPHDTRILREAAPIQSSVAIKLLILLAIAPLVNVLTIALALENSTLLSVKDAGLTGVSLGIRPNLELTQTLPVTDFCNRAAIDTKKGDDALSEFVECTTSFEGIPVTSFQGAVRLYVFRSVMYYMHVQVGDVESISVTRATIRSDNGNFVLKAHISNSSAGALADFGLSLIAPLCRSDVRQSEDFYVQHRVSQRPGFETAMQFILGKRIPCNPANETDLVAARRDLLKTLKKYVSLVPSDSLQITNEGHTGGNLADEDVVVFSSGEDLPFLSRRTRNFGVLILAILAVTVIVLRLFSSLIWNNDIEEGIDLVVKKTLDLKCCDSLLREGERTVDYNKKFQNDHVAHYGMAPRGLSEVENFSGGIVGADLMEYEYDRFTASSEEK